MMVGPRPEHDCPGGCGRSVPYHKLACLTCWYNLPDELRSEVNAAYRNRLRWPREHLAAVGRAARWYRENLTGRADR